MIEIFKQIKRIKRKNKEAKDNFVGLFYKMDD